MINAEIAREITRSRNQTASTGAPRAAGLPSLPFHVGLGLPSEDIPGVILIRTLPGTKPGKGSGPTGEDTRRSIAYDRLPKKSDHGDGPEDLELVSGHAFRRAVTGAKSVRLQPLLFTPSLNYFFAARCHVHHWIPA